MNTERGDKLPVGRPRRTPATIQRRDEPDPVDVVLSPVASASSGRRDVGDGDSIRAATTRQATPDVATLPPGQRHRDIPATRREAHEDVATSDTDTTPNRATKDEADVRRDADPAGDTTATGDEPGSAGRDSRPHERRVTDPRRRAEETECAQAMRSTSYSMPPALTSRLRAAQHHTQLRPGGYANVSELVREAVRRAVEDLEDAYNSGNPFPEVGRLSTGPSPVGAVRGAQIRAQNRQRKTEANGPEARGEGSGAVTANPVPEGLDEGGKLSP